MPHTLSPDDVHFQEDFAAGRITPARFDVTLDSKIMLLHYSAGLLFSPEARAAFVEPDLDPIPRYKG
jgi:hypothetical protein